MTITINRYYFYILYLCLLALAPGCTGASDLAENGATTVTAPPATDTPDPRLAEIEAAWKKGPHADTYALEKGPNTYCARCHSPANWDVEATIDPPPNCVSCKFAFEDEPRVAEGNPLVPEEAWESIDCKVCHRMEADGRVGEVAWHNLQTGYCETVANTSDLCGHCHRDTETLRHARKMGAAAHADFTCTDCHDPHDTTASCDAPGCHSVLNFPLLPPRPEHQGQQDVSGCPECHNAIADIHMGVLEERPVACMDCHGFLFATALNPRLAAGHSEAHSTVACVACHDAAGLEVGPVEGQSVWMTYRTTELLGRSQTASYQSHRLTREVDCQSCHFAGNQWDLPVAPASGDGEANGQ